MNSGKVKVAELVSKTWTVACSAINRYVSIDVDTRAYFSVADASYNTVRANTTGHREMRNRKSMLLDALAGEVDRVLLEEEG